MRMVAGFLVALALIGCGRKAPIEGNSVDSAGIRIVTNAGTDRPVEWSLQRLFLIGGDDSGATSFTKANSNVVVAAGGVFHLVTEDKQVVTFDSLGRHVRTVGRAGDGPGEIRFAGSISAAPDGSVGVFDYHKEAIVRFGPDGAILPIRSVRGLGQAWRWIKARGDSLLMTTIAVDSSGAGTISLKWVGPIDTVVVASIRPGGKAGMVDLGCVGLSGQAPTFAPGLAFDWNGREIALVKLAEYEVAVYTGTTLTRLIRRETAPVPATVAMAERFYPDGFKVSFGGGRPPCRVSAADYVAKMGMAAVVPAVDEVRFGPDGALWVRRFAFPNEPNTYDTFDPDGRYLGTVTTPGPVAGFPTGSIALLILADSATGGTRIGGFRIVRR